MTQNALTIVTDVAASDVDRLDTLLISAGENIGKSGSLIPFDQLTMLHFCCWVILRTGTGTAQLVFESNFDGECMEFLQTLASVGGPGLEQIYQGTAGYPCGAGALQVAKFLYGKAVTNNTFYVGCTGLTRETIVGQAALRERIEAFLDRSPPASGATPDQVRDSIFDYVQSDPELKWALTDVPPPRPSSAGFWVIVGIGLLILLAFLGWLHAAFGLSGVLVPVGAVLAGVALFALMLRHHESTEPSISDQPMSGLTLNSGTTQTVVTRENWRPQNHLTSLTEVKPGRFRLTLLKLVLAVVNLGARHIFNKGNLGGIPSIHFARWLLVNNGRHLVFLSNFDDSWEHYLGEFIDQASNGLTAVWSNTVGFPRTKWLILGGARDEQRFKYFARKSQAVTRLWYSAYPYLSVTNILNNAEIHRGLVDKTNDEESIRAWLRRF